jgi:glycopeptide antibiotics resistance protein
MKQKGRRPYGLLILPTTLVGMATRRYPSAFHEWIASYGGDILYATLILFILRFLLIRSRLFVPAALSFGCCVFIECLQLYQAPWITGLRKTGMGGLLLGHQFLWTDMLCYAAGVGTGWLIAFLLERDQRLHHSQ